MSTGPDSSSEKPSDFGFTESNVNSKQFYQELIASGNRISLQIIFNKYGVRANEHMKSCSCPFPNHNDKTPSFLYYPETNSFYCHGCKVGGLPVNFVANMENISKPRAASKILEEFDSDSDFVGVLGSASSYAERLELLVDFGNFAREIHQSFDAQILAQFRKLSAVFDRMNARYNISNEALKFLSEKIKERYDLFLQQIRKN